MAGTPRIFADLTALYQGAAQFFIERAQLAIAARGRFTVSLAGGSTPKKLYQLLASEPYKSQVNWSAVHLFWGDERYIPYNHSDSNYRMVKEALFDHVPIPEENIHGMPVGYTDLEEAAQAYSQELEAFFDGDIRLDLTFLGMSRRVGTAQCLLRFPLVVFGPKATERTLLALRKAPLWVPQATRNSLQAG